MMIEVRIVVTSWGKWYKQDRHKGISWSAGNALYLYLGGGEKV